MFKDKHLVQHEDRIKTYQSEGKEVIVYDFNEEERGDFQENKLIVFEESAAKLKTEFSEEMEIDSSFTGEGTLLRKTIDKSKFARFEKVEVV